MATYTRYRTAKDAAEVARPERDHYLQATRVHKLDHQYSSPLEATAMLNVHRLLAALVLMFAVALPLASGQSRPTERDVDAANKTATALLRQGKIAAAINEFQKALVFAKQVYGPTDANVARISVNLARAYLHDSQYDVAEQLYRENLRALKAVYATRPDRVSIDEIGRALNNFGEFYGTLGQWAKAEEVFVEALKVFVSAGLPAPAAVVKSNLGRVYRKMGKYDDALNLSMSSLDYRIKQYGPNDARVSPALSSVACILSDLKKHEEAEKIFRRVLAINDRIQGIDRDVATLANLSLELMHLGQLDEAEKLRVKVIKRSEELWGAKSASSSAGRCRLAVIKRCRGEWPEATSLMYQGMKDRRPAVVQAARGLTESEQLTSLQDFAGDDLSDALSVGFAGRADPDTTAKAAECVFNVKGTLFEVMAERTLLLRDGKLTGKPTLVDDLRDTRRLLTEHLNAPVPADPAGKKSHQQRSRELIEKEEQLSRELGRAGGRDRAAPQWVELETVRKALPAGQVLVEVAKVELRDFANKVGPKGQKIEPHYLAWVIPAVGGGDVVALDLGSAVEVETGVAKLLKNLVDFERAGKSYVDAREKLDAEKLPKPEAEKRVTALLQKLLDDRRQLEETYRADSLALSKRILHPLLKAAGGAKTWVVSPDADLWLLPWAALVTPDENYLAESISLRQVVTGRDLLPAPAANPKAQQPPLVIADPNYDRGIIDPKNQAGKAKRLRFTRVEASSIEADLMKIAGVAPVVKLDDDATEEVLKTTRSPRILVLCTHGQFGKIDVTELRPGHGFVYENPLLRCELLFAGCNRKRATNDPTEDGALFGLEVLGLDLRETELVYLSACESAQGDVHAGQAAAGLRQAFQLAGARAVVGTLWSVDDKMAAEFSKKFFARVAAGESNAASLAGAQRDQRAELVKTYGFAHPFLWATHSLTSRGP
jgi:CHAT domain-containing protein/Tfp pilus assembly protein PilF